MNNNQISFERYAAPEVHMVSVGPSEILCQSGSMDYVDSSIEDITREDFDW